MNIPDTVKFKFKFKFKFKYGSLGTSAVVS